MDIALREVESAVLRYLDGTYLFDREKHIYVYSLTLRVYQRSSFVQKTGGFHYSK